MIPLTPRFSRNSHILLVIGIACLVSTLAGLVFVAAQSETDGAIRTNVSAPTTEAATKARVAKGFGKLPLSFESNKGQTDPSVKFLSRGPGYDLFLTPNEAVLSLRKPQAHERSVLRLKMIGANADPRIEGQDQLPGRVNYFVGSDPEKWRRSIPTYRKVQYTNVYAGIDVVYYGNQRELEYDFVVAPGANPKLIKFKVEGAERLRLDQKGNLVVALKHGEVQLNKPFIYQLTDDGSRSEVKGSYVINGNVVSFKVRGVDSGKPLVIDPVLSYSTFLGGNGLDQAFGIAVDNAGNAYVTGTASSFFFPTTQGAFETGELTGAFITKLDPTGSTLIYSTFLSGREPGVVTGSSPFTTATAIAVDSSGNAYVTGATTAADFPVVNALKTSGIFFKTTNGGLNWSNNSTGLPEGLSCLAVAPNNSNIIYAGDSRGVHRSTDAGATWTGTSTTGLPAFPFIGSIAIDPTNASVVYAGSSGLFKTSDGGNNWTALNIPVNNANVRSIVFDPSTPSTIYAGSDAGVFKSTNSGSTWTTLNNFGTSSVPSINSLAIDPTATSIIYAGTSGSGLFKTTNGGTSWVGINNGISTGFGANPLVIDDVTIDPFNSSTLYINVVGKINKSTNGGTSWALVNNSAVSGGINAMVADHANPSTLYVGTVGGGVIKTTDGGTSWSGVNTGLWAPIIRVLATDPSNASVLYAGGSDIVLTNDAFVSKLNAAGSDLLFSTYLGGSGNDTGKGIAVDGSGNIYVAGNTGSQNFPTQNALQPAPSSQTENAFVTKMNPAVPSYVFSTYLGGGAKDQANSIAVDSSGNAYVTGNTVSTNFPLANAFQSTLGDTVAGDAFVTKLTSSGALSYSTYLGGGSADDGLGIAIDVSGNAYVTGETLSTNFPTANAIQPIKRADRDAFVTKLNSQGSALVYSTFLGGSNVDVARGIAVDANGNTYVTGFTHSSDFPVVAGALRTRSSVFKSADAATNWSNDNYGLTSPVTHLVIHPTQPLTLYAGTANGVFRSTDGGKTWSPINNGLNARFVAALVIDPLTPSTLYVVVDALGGTAGVYKSTDGGNSWNRRINGMFDGHLSSLAIDPVTPTSLYAGAFNSPIYKTTNGADNWVPLGGSPLVPPSLSVDPHTPTRIFAANAIVGGIFRTTNGGGTWQSVLTLGNGDGFWVGVSPLTPGLVYATLRDFGLFRSVDGGDNWTLVRAGHGKIVFDPVSASTLYFLSNTEGLLKSTDNGQTWVPMNNGLPLKNTLALAINPLKTSSLYLALADVRDEDAFVTKINPAGTALIYSTFLGGIQSPNDPFNVNDEAYGIAVDSAGNAYVTGFTLAPDFPTTPNVFQPVNLGFGEVFISKLTMSFSISGHVLDGGGAPVSGAEVVLTDGASVTSITTEADGAYEFSHLREGGSFTVSVFKPHFTMAPPSQSFNNLSSNQVVNFTATATNAAFFTISGQVTDNGAPLAGVTLTLGGSQAGVRITDNNGNYSFEVAGGGNYTVTPSSTLFAFGPTSQTFNNLSASQTANFTATRQSIVVTNANNHGTGSLRDAINKANAIFGADTIVFNIPGPGVKVINLITPLPEITEAVVIDASTQPGYAGAPLIELAGDNSFLTSGLVITAGNTTVRGLAIGGFEAGIVLRSCNNNVIQGDYIGVDATGTMLRSNFTGVMLSDSSNNVIGGTSAAARNVISGNVTGGIIVSDDSFQNSIRGNSIFSNDGLGIDLGSTGVTVNDPGDSDSGANNLQNFPVLTSVIASANSTTIQGSLNSTPNTTFAIDFYSSAALDPLGHGEGALFFGTTSITTDGSGNATINASIPAALPAGRVITATATDPNGNTSEFSAGDVTMAGGNLQFSVSSIQLIEDRGVLNISVVRKGGSAGNVSVDFTTADVTAIAGQDYTATSGMLNFSSGETSKIIQVPIANDAPTEPDETFMVVLRNPSNLEALGSPNVLVVTVQDRTTVPSVFIDSRSVAEGNAGATTEALFTASISAQTGRTITVNFATSNMIATSGVSCASQGTDYETKSGTLTFQPGDSAFAIPIRICGDSSAEADETFKVVLSNPGNASVIDEGIGTIVDDDELELLLEESPQIANQVAAIDALLFLRDPFRVMSLPDWLAVGSDRNTRVMFFVRNLQLNPGEPASAVVVRLGTGAFQFPDVFAEDVRSAPNVDFTQVIIRLPDGLDPGTYTVTIRAHTRSSNTGTIRIAAP